MKKNIFLFIMNVFAWQLTQAQVTSAGKVDSTIQAGWGDLNYAVPESPAFKILGVSPSNIMRPTSTKDIAFSVGNYLFGNGGTIPQNLAVEISPSLFNPGVNLNQFRKDRIWYTSALSIGTKVNSDKSYSIAVGLKINIIDDQDLRSSQILQQKYDQYGPDIVHATFDAKRAVVEELYLKDPSKTKITYLREVSDAYSNEKDPQHSSIKKEIDDKISKKFKMSRIADIRDSVKNLMWNKPIWTLGVATIFNSKDSLLRDIQPASKLGLWTTIGLPLGPKGQLLFGITGQLRDSLTNHLSVGTLNIGARAYYGANDLKGFIEGNSMMQSYQKGTFKASVGIETTFFGGLWFDFSLGLSKQGDAKAVFTPGFNMFFGSPEKKATGS